MNKDCPHPTFVSEICVRCGAQFKFLPASVQQRIAEAKTNVVVGAAGLAMHISEEETATQKFLNTQDLVSRKKLALLIDLDQTLLHTSHNSCFHQLMTNSADAVKSDPEKNPFHNQDRLDIKKDVHTIRMTNGEFHYVKMRPGCRAFLEALAPYYDLYVFTMGVREYADLIVRELDPTGRLLKKVVARGENKTEYKSIDSLLPVDQALALTLDDLPRVWAQFRCVLGLHQYLYWADEKPSTRMTPDQRYATASQRSNPKDNILYTVFRLLLAIHTTFYNIPLCSIPIIDLTGFDEMVTSVINHVTQKYQAVSQRKNAIELVQLRLFVNNPHYKIVLFTNHGVIERSMEHFVLMKKVRDAEVQVNRHIILKEFEQASKVMADAINLSCPGCTAANCKLYPSLIENKMVFDSETKTAKFTYPAYTLLQTLRAMIFSQVTYDYNEDQYEAGETRQIPHQLDCNATIVQLFRQFDQRNRARCKLPQLPQQVPDEQFVIDSVTQFFTPQPQPVAPATPNAPTTTTAADPGSGLASPSPPPKLLVPEHQLLPYVNDPFATVLFQNEHVLKNSHNAQAIHLTPHQPPSASVPPIGQSNGLDGNGNCLNDDDDDDAKTDMDSESSDSDTEDDTPLLPKSIKPLFCLFDEHIHAVKMKNAEYNQRLKHIMGSNSNLLRPTTTPSSDDDDDATTTTSNSNSTTTTTTTTTAPAPSATNTDETKAESTKNDSNNQAEIAQAKEVLTAAQIALPQPPRPILADVGDFEDDDDVLNYPLAKAAVGAGAEAVYRPRFPEAFLSTFKLPDPSNRTVPPVKLTEDKIEEEKQRWTETSNTGAKSESDSPPGAANTSSTPPLSASSLRMLSHNYLSTLPFDWTELAETSKCPTRPFPTHYFVRETDSRSISPRQVAILKQIDLYNRFVFEVWVNQAFIHKESCEFFNRDNYTIIHPAQQMDFPGPTTSSLAHFEPRVQFDPNSPSAAFDAPTTDPSGVTPLDRKKPCPCTLIHNYGLQSGAHQLSLNLFDSSAIAPLPQPIHVVHRCYIDDSLAHWTRMPEGIYLSSLSSAFGIDHLTKFAFIPWLKSQALYQLQMNYTGLEVYYSDPQNGVYPKFDTEEAVTTTATLVPKKHPLKVSLPLVQRSMLAKLAKIDAQTPVNPEVPNSKNPVGVPVSKLHLFGTHASAFDFFKNFPIAADVLSHYRRFKHRFMQMQTKSRAAAPGAANSGSAAKAAGPTSPKQDSMLWDFRAFPYLVPTPGHRVKPNGAFDFLSTVNELEQFGLAPGNNALYYPYFAPPTVSGWHPTHPLFEIRRQFLPMSSQLQIGGWVRGLNRLCLADMVGDVDDDDDDDGDAESDSETNDDDVCGISGDDDDDGDAVENLSGFGAPPKRKGFAETTGMDLSNKRPRRNDSDESMDSDSFVEL